MAIALVFPRAALVAGSADPPDESAPTAAQFETLRGFLVQHCVDCHGGGEPEAELALDQLQPPGPKAEENEIWRLVLDNLGSGTMPPQDEPQPTLEARAAAVEQLRRLLGEAGLSAKPDPGRVTMRRLNRAEYNNTVSDLFGIECREADDFPSDDVGYGFDNVGDVLSLPPLLFERYIAAAEQISGRLIVLPESLKPKTTRIEAESLPDSAPGRVIRNRVRALYSDAEVPVEFDFPTPGKYMLRARAFGDQAGDEPVRMTLRCGDGEPQRFDVDVDRESAKLYEAKIEATAGLQLVFVAFTNDYYRPDDPDPENRDRNFYFDYVEIEGPLDGGHAPLNDVHRRVLFRTPRDSKEELECAREILAYWSRRAYRRPVSTEEVERLVDFVELARDNEESFERGIQLAMQAMLVSPYFLYRVEAEATADTDAEHDPPSAETEPLGDYELASRLSYFLWSSLPDETLLEEAARGTLNQSERLQIHARRMLADPKSQRLVENFASQWLQIRNLATITPDRVRFPDFDDAMRSAMREETLLFFGAIVREDRSILDLLDSDFTFLNQRLAAHYGIEGISGDEFQRVQLTDKRRGGVLTQGSVLAVTSNPTRTSPVKRGRWVLEQLLGMPPPPPPPDVEELAESEELTGTLRQRMEQHRENPSCAACHRRMDPLGFGLENFDAVGAWREQDEGFDIDASGTLTSGESFTGPGELKAILRGKADQFRRCLAQKMLTYALGRGVEDFDQRTIDQIASELANSEDRFSTLISAVVGSEPFLLRRISQEQEP